MSRGAVDGRRLLLVHAHPDDETITTGGTIAHYSAIGADVHVLTCTLGEEGEVIGRCWAGLVAAQADQLGGYRVGELAAALTHLGVRGGPRFLGCAGRWRDSGMAGAPAAVHPRSFVQASDEAVVEAMVTVLRQLRPQVVVTYDPAGSYGHPDHVRVHQATTEAVARAGDPTAFVAAGTPWEVAKLYWTVTEHTALLRGVAAMTHLPDGWRMPAEGELPSAPDDEVDAVVDARQVVAAKLAALRAHATQVTVAHSDTEFALSNNVAQPVLTAEHYVLARGVAGQRGADGREHDLFAGVTGCSA